MIKTVQEEWQEYKKHAYPKGLTNAVQNQETHQAFFSGAYSILTTMLEIAELSEDEGVKVLARLHSEVEAVLRHRINPSKN